MSRKIIKASVSKDGSLKTGIEEEFMIDNEPFKKTSPGEQCTGHIHPDLEEAFKAMRIDLAALTEQYPYTEMEDNPSLLDKFSVTGYSTGGEGEHFGVVIIGERHLADNAVLNLVSKFVKFDSSHANYQYARSLFAKYNATAAEVDLYNFSNKFAPSNQGKFDFDAPTTETEAPKKKRGRKAVMEVSKPDAESEDLAAVN